MLGYTVTDRDRERLVAELDLIAQVDAVPGPSRSRRGNWFGRRAQGLGKVTLPSRQFAGAR